MPRRRPDARISGLRPASPLCALLLLVTCLHGGGGAQAQAQAHAAQGAQGAGFRVAADLAAGAYRIAAAPNVIVHAPQGFDAHAPLHLVVFLHGYNGCVSVLMAEGESRCRPGATPQPGWQLPVHHDDAGTNSLFIVPQLAFMQRDGRPGAFGKEHGFRRFLQELLADTLAAQLGGARTLQSVASITLVAHSGAFVAALSILERGGVSDKVRAIVLLDALYGHADRYARFVEAHAARGLQLVSLHLGQGDTARENRQLHRRLRRRLGKARVGKTRAAELSEAIRRYPVVIGTGRLPHARMPQTHLAEILRALGLPQRSAARAAP